jgi:hypothetical protein
MKNQFPIPKPQFCVAPTHPRNPLRNLAKFPISEFTELKCWI